MDHAVALVEAYLQINGYFTVAEYPVIEATGKHEFKTATDLDILAFRFPGAGCIVTRKKSVHSRFSPATAFGVSGDEADIIIGEVKEGRAELNNNAKNSNVLRIVRARFVCCSIEHVDSIVERIEKDTGAYLIYESDPEKLLHIYEQRHFRRPSCFCEPDQETDKNKNMAGLYY